MASWANALWQACWRRRAKNLREPQHGRRMSGCSTGPATRDGAFRPLNGIRVIEFSQMVMGPTCGLILADLGADVVKIEPIKGDRTRTFKGPASGFFATYCRNKRSFALDTSAAAGQDVARRLISGADIVIENFRPGL